MRHLIPGVALAAALFCGGIASAQQRPATPAPARAAATQADQTLRDIQARGTLRCAVFGTLPGFSAPDGAGVMRGMDADFCRAVAAAALGNAQKVTFVTAATPTDAIRLVATRQVDLASRNLTITYSRDTEAPIVPTGVLYFDGQGVLARRDSGITSLRQMKGKIVCAAGGNGLMADSLLRNWATANGVDIAIVTLASSNDLSAALRENRCDAISADRAALAARRITDFDKPADYVLLPEVISREPLAPIVHADAGAWRDVVTWALNALIAGEELGIASTGVDPAASPANPEVANLIGFNPQAGRSLGLPADWAKRMIAQVGNYGEIFERNLGQGSLIKLDRGLNDLWLRGGLLYPLPLR